ncbi:hypothetical protein Tco_0525238 [Tanacetum coccineum]
MSEMVEGASGLPTRLEEPCPKAQEAAHSSGAVDFPTGKDNFQVSAGRPKYVLPCWGETIVSPGSIKFGPEERVRLLVGSHGASTTPIYSPGSSTTPIYSPGASTTPIYSPGSSSTPIYSPGASRNAECSNCKHLLDKITILEAMLELYKNSEQHTLNSAALLHEVYNDMEKLDLE